MKIVFVRPNYPTYFATPSLALGYLSSSSKSKGIETVIIDGVKTNIDEDNIIKKIELEAPEWVCITCLSEYFKEVKSLAIKLKRKNYKVIIGGVHPTFMPYMTLVETECDYVICGEGEISVPQLVLQGNNKDIKGVYSLNDLKSEETPFIKSEYVKNLDEIPFPDWENMNPKTYPPSPMGMIAKSYPLAVMMSSRGCVHGCVFCAGGQLYDRKVRFRSPENVVAEMKLLVNKYGVKEIQFLDDNMILNREHIEKICQLIIKEKIKVHWSCPNGIRADNLDFKLAKLMKKAGCYLVTIGIESANPQILKNIKKNETIETITNAIQAAHDAKLVVHGAFVLSLPGDTKETMRETIEYAKKMPLDRAFFTIMDIIPGCELWQKDKKRYNKFLTCTSYAEPSLIPEGMTKDEILKIQETAMREFYFRPKIMFNIIKLIRLTQVKYILIRLSKFRLISSFFNFLIHK